ncbi:GGDEF domain-containing phosphodiesterase [Bacillus kwashiorkori]|uniref:GGDEF domain-containing phosphodiesterase n=1 Tax=Bacillus kwashiorkori TaxID=1522318 RepID=UPI000784E0CA|nr:GGDEF domain-containing phosphodiesterase [Bacillus kwashiorkori]
MEKLFHAKCKFVNITLLMILLLVFALLLTFIITLSYWVIHWSVLVIATITNLALAIYYFKKIHNDTFRPKKFIAEVLLVALAIGVVELLYKSITLKEWSLSLNLTAVNILFMPLLLFIMKVYYSSYCQNKISQENEERYRSLFYQTQNGVYELDKEGRFIHLNDAFAKWLGIAPTDLLGQYAIKIVHEDDQEKSLQYFQQTLTGKSHTFELKVKHIDGNVRYISVTHVPIVIDDGVIGIYGICNDITTRHNTEKALKESESQLRILYNILEVGIWSYNLDEQKLLFCSNGIGKITGYTNEEFFADYDLYFNLIHPDDSERVFKNRKKLGKGKINHFTEQYRMISKNGEVRFINEQIFLTKNENGSTVLNGILIDNTELVEKTMELQESEERYKRLIQFLPSPFFIIKENRIIFTNEAGVELLGARLKEEILNKEICSFLDEKSIERLKNVKIAELTNSYLTDINVKTLSGEKRIVETTSTYIPYRGEDALFVVIHDVTDRRQIEEQIHFLAFHDDLTMLPNRRMMLQQLEGTIYLASKKSENVAVLTMDIDRFKWVNDTFSREVGDKLLQLVAKKLTNTLGKDIFIARISGDEWAIILEDMKSKEEIEEVAKKVLLCISEKPFEVNNWNLYITLSIGIAVFPEDGDNVDTLLKHADEALYQVKKRGKNHCLFYEKQFSSEISAKGIIEYELREALKFQQFVLHYQPQVDSITNKIVGVEALIRWHHPTRGIVFPGEFIPLTEETGQIIPIGNWVLEQACRKLKEWEQAGYLPLHLSVNISTKQFQQHNFTETVKRIVEKTKVNPHYLTIELTESVALENIEEVIQKMLELKKIGMKIAIDDFGTGYSSLAYLKRLPIDTLKIAQQFVRDIEDSHDAIAIVRTIALLGHNLGLELIAEGVEKTGQLKLLNDLKCQKIQGFLFSKPLTDQELLNKLR